MNTYFDITVYFLFALETAQTTLTGSDVYYWFIAAPGDIEHLRSSHYAFVDISMMVGVSSVIVQMCFCYRIWTLTRNAWLCTTIAVVCAPDPPRIYQALDVP